MKATGLLVALACLSLARLYFVQGNSVEISAGALTQGSRCGPGSDEWRVYDADPGHLWNRLHRSLYLRTAGGGREYGRDELDPLLWAGTRHLLGGESNARATKCLGEFVAAHAEQLVTDPLKRALLQRDLWAVFDWAAQRSDARTPETQELLRRLAEAVRRLALSPAQVESLPDTYRAAAASGAFAPDYDPRDPDAPFLPPDLFQRDGPWVQLAVAGGGGPTAPSHLFSASGRSVFRVLISLPQGRAATLAYLKSVAEFGKLWVRDRRTHADPRPNPRLPQFPSGTRLALVRQLVVINERGEPVPTRVVESVQIRLHRSIPSDIPEAFNSGRGDARAALAVCEFRLSRALLFAGEAGGLRAVARDERELPLFQSHGVDPFEFQGGREPFETQLSPVLGSCTICHFRPGIHSVLSRTPDLLQLRLRDVRRDLVPAPSDEHEADMTKNWKVKQESWRLLRELWEGAER